MFKILIFILLTPFVFASNVLISDVDDTIKDSQVRDYWEMLKRGRRTGPEMMVPGMRELLYLAKENGHSDKLFYVSKIPSFLDGYHREFLTNNNFPEGVLVSRGFGSSFKLNAIKKIINETQPLKLSLIGDNGEADAEVYNEIRKYAEQRGIIVRSFIRKSYSDNIKSYPKMIYFSKPEEIAPLFLKDLSGSMYSESLNQ